MNHQYKFSYAESKKFSNCCSIRSAQNRISLCWIAIVGSKKKWKQKNSCAIAEENRWKRQGKIKWQKKWQLINIFFLFFFRMTRARHWWQKNNVPNFFEKSFFCSFWPGFWFCLSMFFPFTVHFYWIGYRHFLWLIIIEIISVNDFYNLYNRM